MHKDDARLQQLLQRSELADFATGIRSLLWNTIRLTSRRVADEAELPLGASKIGGNPDLPSDTPWPTWNGHPLPFLAQIRLADLAPCDPTHELPHHGMLAFFYDPSHNEYPIPPERFRVLSYPSSAGLYRATPTEEPSLCFPPCALTYTSSVTLPPPESSELACIGLPMEAFFYPEQPEKLEQAAGAYEELITYLDHEEHEAPRHQLLGHPYQIQGDLLQECVRDTDYQGPPTDWRLLFQLDTDATAEMMWGDCGAIYFYILKRDLAARDFSHVHLILQCC
ncbi:uncharacterized protein YwqG [Thermosporothrix hazakensis]|jgi:uncharacterized protein YwqG|uniref:Uncharacterized protein YwqG n=1 Tax=Thermosporothrix hazakensis TaxID=644383 RepID=A0A326TVW0_THEHA|nr:YwqG family protein [Thermosporothrix hazakensis]PZW21056.1 uncharacterized protein YwqG [Thermosporothrix hazakensis]GCE46378.1 hypothetical protein KTH_12470 [Thermosporothrix hazakensis]